MTESKMNNTEFFNHLHNEKLKAQEARTTYTIRKLAYATTLLGFGSLDIERFDLSLLLYLVPFVTIAFDLQILAEDYSVKRIGAFLSVKSADVAEQHWEKWVSRNRDPFAPIAMPLLTTLLLLGSAIVITLVTSTAGPFFWVWLGLAGLSSWVLFGYYRWLRKRAVRNIESDKQYNDDTHPSSRIRQLRMSVESADNLINNRAYQKVKHLFSACMTDSRVLANLKATAPEHGKHEYLLCVDSQGVPVYPTQEMVTDFRETATRYPDFGLWFQEATANEGDEKPVLLVARWLCHLAGFRHQAVHLFIDHPTLKDQTLVQVRSFTKAESPGCFDLPAAGHVAGFESVEETILKELSEELNLSSNDLDTFEMVGSYNYSRPMENPKWCNVEFRVVFRSRIKASSLPKMEFADGEVAAVSTFSLFELRSLCNQFPERVASGLLASLRCRE